MPARHRAGIRGERPEGSKRQEGAPRCSSLSRPDRRRCHGWLAPAHAMCRRRRWRREDARVGRDSRAATPHRSIPVFLTERASRRCCRRSRSARKAGRHAPLSPECARPSDGLRRACCGRGARVLLCSRLALPFDARADAAERFAGRCVVPSYHVPNNRRRCRETRCRRHHRNRPVHGTRWPGRRCRLPPRNRSETGVVRAAPGACSYLRPSGAPRRRRPQPGECSTAGGVASRHFPGIESSSQPGRAVAWLRVDLSRRGAGAGGRLPDGTGGGIVRGVWFPARAPRRRQSQ
jgi:hypothetical protein